MKFEPRKIIRLQNYDYSTNGAYFITICVENGHEILGQIVGDGALDVPCKNDDFSSVHYVKLTNIGEIVKRHIENTDNAYDGEIKLDKYVIMPNHIHILIMLNNAESANSGTSRAPSPTNQKIPQIISTLKTLITKELGYSIWQRSFHDHIIRNEEAYKKIWNYIDTNPQNWGKDKYYNKNNYIKQ